MAKWEIKVERDGEIIRTELFRDGKHVGGAYGVIKGSVFEVIGSGISVEKKYQREYMEANKGVKMGEALGLELLNLLKKEGVSYILPNELTQYGERAIERGISSGGIEKTPDGLLKINWEMVPATKEEAMKELAGKLRAVDAEAAAKRANEAKAKADAKAAKIKRAREWAKRVFRRRPK